MGKTSAVAVGGTGEGGAVVGTGAGVEDDPHADRRKVMIRKDESFFIRKPQRGCFLRV